MESHELKELYDTAQAYAKGFADGAASILQTIAKKEDNKLKEAEVVKAAQNPVKED